jgi:hypothetical protein
MASSEEVIGFNLYFILNLMHLGQNWVGMGGIRWVNRRLLFYRGRDVSGE